MLSSPGSTGVQEASRTRWRSVPASAVDRPAPAPAANRRLVPGARPARRQIGTREEETHAAPSSRPRSSPRRRWPRTPDAPASAASVGRGRSDLHLDTDGTRAAEEYAYVRRDVRRSRSSAAASSGSSRSPRTGERRTRDLGRAPGLGPAPCPGPSASAGVSPKKLSLTPGRGMLGDLVTLWGASPSTPFLVAAATRSCSCTPSTR